MRSTGAWAHPREMIELVHDNILTLKMVDVERVTAQFAMDTNSEILYLG
jgi:hypothetical protein